MDRNLQIRSYQLCGGSPNDYKIVFYKNLWRADSILPMRELRTRWPGYITLPSPENEPLGSSRYTLVPENQILVRKIVTETDALAELKDLEVLIKARVDKVRSLGEDLKVKIKP